MKKNVKAMYVAPVVELLEARVEKGFAGSEAPFHPSELEDVPMAEGTNSDLSSGFGTLSDAPMGN